MEISCDARHPAAHESLPESVQRRLGRAVRAAWTTKTGRGKPSDLAFKSDRVKIKFLFDWARIHFLSKICTL